MLFLRLFARNVAIALGSLAGVVIYVMGAEVIATMAADTIGPAGGILVVVAAGSVLVAGIATACQVSERRAG